MRSDKNQMQLGIKPKPTVADWRAATETCAQQFPGDVRRLRYCQEQTEMAERAAGTAEHIDRPAQSESPS
uniref:hypothetical protein n=1 Tax=Xanthomonas albilineans TaxID=29447 RepID=UPI0027DC5DAE|nr:hypothetical protein [Xanthomonas albilineans]